MAKAKASARTRTDSPALADSHEARVSETATTLIAPVDPALLAAATAPPGDSQGGTAIVRCNGCARKSEPAETVKQALGNALANGWFMSEHDPPLPYCEAHKPVDLLGRIGRGSKRT
jgi:hypothetical protein